MRRPCQDSLAYEMCYVRITSKKVGGDLYDYMLLDDDHLLFSVGDVSDKGVPAALFMMTAKTFIDSYAEQKLSPAVWKVWRTPSIPLRSQKETAFLCIPTA